MKKKIKYRNSSLVYTTGLSSTDIQEDGAVSWQAYCIVDKIKIDPNDEIRFVFSKLLGQAIKEILELGEIYVKLFLDLKNIDQILLDDYKVVILGLGFEQVSKTRECIVFSFGEV